MKITEETGVVQIKKQGPPSVLEYSKQIVGEPGNGEVLIRHKAIALNFVDVLFRNGSFPVNQLPAIIGVEAAGVVEAVGENVVHLKEGDRVVYFFSIGAYAERRLINASDLIKIPDNIHFDEAASLMAKGLTARMLIKQAYAIKPGDVVIVHAAAGGVGSLVSRWAKALGAQVIGTVGSSSKKERVLQAGIDHVIALDKEDLGVAVHAIIHGEGVQAVFDGVGKATFEESVKLIKIGGTAVLYGNASGAPSIDQKLLTANQIKLVRPALGQYLPDRESVDTASAELFEAFSTGILGKIEPTIYHLSDVAKAHQDLESSQTTGSVIFHP
ncbi:quinone oxidoreductase family protein [Desertivirga brevis]|uniref:quinone oxidoreductase family protein n=1 Tax=Desertivirga brevis TaxID=2810310 RepID=UPI001A96E17B|nr:quinone oxidoreductase [Pedobacter sp. SYSU D00873]